MAKSLEDITLEDFLKYKGSRWKKSLTDSGVDMEGLVADLATFLNDVPECRNVRAYVLFGDTPRERVTDVDGYDSDMLYEFYLKHEEILSSISVGNGVDIELFDVNETVDSYTVPNPDVAEYREEIVSINRKLDNRHSSISNLINDINSLASDVADYEIKVTEIKERIEAKSDDDITTVDMLGIVSDGLKNNGFQLLKAKAYDDGELDVKFSAPPRLMYDVNIPTRKPVNTLPLFFTICIGERRYLKPHALGRIYHPHVSEYNICWGDMSIEANHAIKTNEFDTLFELLDKLIRNYNSGSPYITWSSVSRVANYNSMLRMNTDSSISYMDRLVSEWSVTNNNIPLEYAIGEELADAYKHKKKDSYEEYARDKEEE